MAPGHVACMATVSEQIPCPQCGAQAEYEINTRSFTEWTYCARCGYRHDTSEGQPLAGHGSYAYSAGQVTQFGAFTSPDPSLVSHFRAWVKGETDLQTAVLRLPPLYRAEYLTGMPEGFGHLTPTERQQIDEVLARFDERVAAADQNHLYTTHAQHPGLKVLSLYRDADSLHLAQPGDCPDAVVLTGDQVKVDSDALAAALSFA